MKRFGSESVAERRNAQHANPRGRPEGARQSEHARDIANPLKSVAHPPRFEHGTVGLEGRCSSD